MQHALSLKFTLLLLLYQQIYDALLPRTWVLPPSLRLLQDIVRVTIKELGVAVDGASKDDAAPEQACKREV